MALFLLHRNSLWYEPSAPTSPSIHDGQNLAKQRAIEFGQTAFDDPEDDLFVSSQTQSTILINQRNTSLDLEPEDKPRGFFADQFEVNRL